MTRPRTGLVLGGGGVLGAAWMTGALAAVQDRLPVPAGELDVVLGTSAGSVLAAALRSGFTVADLVAHQSGGPAGPLSAIGSPDLGGAAMPPRPQLRIGSPRLLRTVLRAPRRVHPWVVVNACLPRGRAEHDQLRAMLATLTGSADAEPGSAGEGWPDGGQTWIVAVDYDSGQRVAFGRRGAPAASLPDAVVASCSVPGWFRPADIGGHRYVDGGVRSVASADLLAQAGLDEVYVLAPAATLVRIRARSAWEWTAHRIRRMLTAGLLREVQAVRASGARVTLLTPGREDLAAIGANLMDASRRADVFDCSVRTSARALLAV